MRLSSVLWLLLLLPAVASAEQVRGTVHDKGGEPLSGAALRVVRVQDEKVVARRKAGASGQFTFELPPGDYALRVQHPTLCEEGSRYLEVKGSGALVPVQLELSRCVRITGRALLADGSPLAGGRATLHWTPEGSPTLTVTTDAQGRFTLPRAPQGRVIAFLQDAAGNTLDAQVRLSAPRQLELRVRRALPVLVRGPTGAPLPGARVELIPEPLAAANQEGLTDARGLTDVPATPGRHRLLAYWEEKDAFVRYVWRDVELGPEAGGAPLELHFAQRASVPLSGHVRTPEGLAAPGAEVTARQLVPSVPLDDVFLRNTAYPLEKATTRTDANGRFTFPDLREGEYILEVEHASGSGKALARTGPQGAGVSLKSDCPGGASGRVVDEQGTPVTRFQAGGQEVTDAQGRFSLQGRCDFSISAEGFLPRAILLPGPTREEVKLQDVVLQRGRRIEVRLVHADGRPAVSYPIVASWSGPQWGRRSEFTDASGRFVLGPVPADVEVVLETFVYDHDLRHRVPPDARGEVTLRLVPQLPARLEVRVLSAEGQPLPGVLVTAHHEEARSDGWTDSSGRVLLPVRPGGHEVTGRDVRPIRGLAAPLVPHRFAPVQAQVPEKGTARAELRATRGTGALRVLLPKATHYNDVYVLPGVHSWPASISAVESQRGALEADTALDCDSQPGSFCFRSILADFSELAPGTYTVFAKDASGAIAGGAVLFRRVVEAESGRRLAIPVRFQGDEARQLPWAQ